MNTAMKKIITLLLLFFTAFTFSQSINVNTTTYTVPQLVNDVLINSPCINAGFTGFYPRADVVIDAKYGATEITLPGRDIGAFQRSGLGNVH